MTKPRPLPSRDVPGEDTSRLMRISIAAATLVGSMRARSDRAPPGGMPDVRRLHAIVVAALAMLALACVTATSAPSARAYGDAPPRAQRFVVRGPMPAGLALRIAGQTSDIDWIAVSSDGGDSDTSLAAIFALGRREGARVVVWVDGDVDALTLHIADVREQRLFVRVFDLTIASESVVFEEVGVIVRSTLVALALGVDIGRALGAEEIELEPPVVVADESRGYDPPTPIPPPRTRTRFEGSLGASWAIRDFGDLGHFGPRLRGGIRRGRFTLALDLLDGLTVHDTAGGVRLGVSRFEASALSGYELASRGRLHLDALGRVGVALFRRTTLSANGGAPTPAQTSVAVLMGAELRALLFIDDDSRFGFSLCLGLDVLANRPDYRVRDLATNTTTRVADLAVASPRAELAFVLRLPGEQERP